MIPSSAPVKALTVALSPLIGRLARDMRRESIDVISGSTLRDAASAFAREVRGVWANA